MTSPLDAAFFADRAVQRTVEAVENVRVAADTYRLRFECPEIARRITPGQFVMMRLPGGNDPLLGRPLALYDTVLSSSGEPVAVDVVYVAIGKFTNLLAQLKPPQPLDVWGPLGNGFEPCSGGRLIMVAGGIGQTPFLTLAREHLGGRSFGDPPRAVEKLSDVTLCYGTGTAAMLACVDDFQRIGVRVRLATEDGGCGHHGLVTDVLRQVLTEDDAPARIVCCGPEPMMQAVAQIAAEAETPCQVSLETHMACGIGICFTCVAKVRDDCGSWDYKRTCVEGPVFDAEKIVWK